MTQPVRLLRLHSSPFHSLSTATLAPHDALFLPPPVPQPAPTPPPDASLDLAPLRMVMDDGPHNLPLPAPLEPISQPSSASTQASLAQLPGISALAAGADVSGRSSPQLKPIAATLSLAGPSSLLSNSPSPAPASASGNGTGAGNSTGHLPICQNCATSTTPLWRRDEMGSVLCNACGLFLKLHGRPRPISLKTDVIKSRNRVKTSMRPDMAMKKKFHIQASNAAAAAHAGVGVDQNGVVDLQGQAYAATAALSARRTSQKMSNGHDGHDSPMTGAGNMYAAHNAPTYPILDDNGHYQGPHLQPFGTGASPGRAHSPMNGGGGGGGGGGGDRLDASHAQDQLVAANSSLKTRVAELEVINDFISRRLGHYEPSFDGGQDGHDPTQQQTVESQLRAQVELLNQSEAQLRGQLEESHRRENMLKRRLDELELELKAATTSLGAYESGRAKKPRLDSGEAAAEATETTVDGSAQQQQQQQQQPASSEDKGSDAALALASSSLEDVPAQAAAATTAPAPAPTEEAPSKSPTPPREGEEEQPVASDEDKGPENGTTSKEAAAAAAASAAAVETAMEALSEVMKVKAEGALADGVKAEDKSTLLKQ